MSSPTATSDQSISSSPVLPIVNIDAEIERAKTLLLTLTKQKEEQAKQQANQLNSIIQEFIKRHKIDTRGMLTFLKALDDAGKAVGAKSDAELLAAITQVNELLVQVNVPTFKDLAITIRNRTASSSKAKRLDKPTLDLLREVLKRGAKVPEVAKHFGLAEATVNARKKQWGLVGRKNVRLIPLREALKGLA